MSLLADEFDYLVYVSEYIIEYVRTVQYSDVKEKSSPKYEASPADCQAGSKFQGANGLLSRCVVASSIGRTPGSYVEAATSK